MTGCLSGKLLIKTWRKLKHDTMGQDHIYPAIRLLRYDPDLAEPAPSIPTGWSHQSYPHLSG